MHRSTAKNAGDQEGVQMLVKLPNGCHKIETLEESTLDFLFLLSMKEGK